MAKLIGTVNVVWWDSYGRWYSVSGTASSQQGPSSRYVAAELDQLAALIIGSGAG